jgi:hypothetical protein
VPDNKQTFKTGSVVMTVAGTALQLDDCRVPAGHSVLLLAHPSNTEYMYVGETKAQAEAHHIELDGGDSVRLYVDNVHDIWVDCSVSQGTETLGWMVELDNADA